MCKSKALSKALTKAIPFYYNKYHDKCFKCSICKQEYELMHDKPIRLKGRLHSKDYDCEYDKQKNMNICAYCACRIYGWDEV
jgi:hypothetical protein